MRFERFMIRAMAHVASDRSGATAIEYALIGMFLSMAIIVSIPLLQNGLSAAFTGAMALFPSF